MGRNDFPFGIKQVAMLMGLKIQTEQPYAIDAKCPFCDDTKYHLNLNLEDNVWRCNRCGESGGMVFMYAKAYGLDAKQAYKAILEGLRIDQKTAPVKKVERKKEAISNRSDGEIHAVYTEMLALPEFKLSQMHYENLRNRGFRDEMIEGFGYKSMPENTKENVTGIPKKLEDMGYNLLGIPGFYREKGRTKIVLDHAGFLIPVRNGLGKIVQAQVRRDDGNPKYVYLSSRYMENGTRTLTRVHTAGNLKKGPDTVYITEGPLKADISSILLDVPFLALQGVNSKGNLNDVLGALKKIGVKTIVEAFDMDKYTNPNVTKAVRQISEMVKAHGLEIKHAKWDPNFKGIDDMLYHDMMMKGSFE